MKARASAPLLAAMAVCFSAYAQDVPVVFEGGYKFDLLHVVSGGLQRGGQSLGHLDLKLKSDLEKVWGWPGTTAFFNLIHDHGGKFNRDRVGSFNGVSNIEVPVDTERLFQAWIQPVVSG